MPLRNLIFLLAMSMFSLLCYAETSRNRFVPVLSEAIEMISRHALEPVTPRQLFENGMHGMLAPIDPYSDYIPRHEYVRFKEDIEQHFGGVGIEVGLRAKRMVILNAIPDGPAHRAGMRAGDVVLAIDGVVIEGESLEVAVQRMRGAAGTQVAVRFLREGDEQPRDVQVERAEIGVESVLGDYRTDEGRWVFKLESDPRIGYIRLSSFGDRSAADFEKAWRSIEGQVDGLVFDLRDNPGGSLAAAIDVADMFLDADRLIVSTRGRDPQQVTPAYYSTSGTVIDPDLPVVILVNHLSASASEIVAACLQDHRRARIVGERTWGKGTVQNVIEIESGQSAIRLTTQTYLRPSGVNIHRRTSDGPDKLWGVQPAEKDRIEFTRDEYRRVALWRRQRDFPRVPLEVTDLLEAPGTETETADPSRPADSVPQSGEPGTEPPSSATPPTEAPPLADETSPPRDAASPTVAGAPPESEPLRIEPTEDRQLQRAVEVLRSDATSAPANASRPARVLPSDRVAV